MAKRLKRYTNISLRLNQDVYDAIERYCEDMGTTRTSVLEMSAREFLEKRGYAVKPQAIANAAPTEKPYIYNK